jgi:hypothetical protein
VGALAHRPLSGAGDDDYVQASPWRAIVIVAAIAGRTKKHLKRTIEPDAGPRVGRLSPRFHPKRARPESRSSATPHCTSP